MPHSREYWDIVALDKVNRTYDISFKRELPVSWKKLWREKFITLIRQQIEYINPKRLYLKDAGWR